MATMCCAMSSKLQACRCFALSPRCIFALESIDLVYICGVSTLLAPFWSAKWIVSSASSRMGADPAALILYHADRSLFASARVMHDVEVHAGDWLPQAVCVCESLRLRAIPRQLSCTMQQHIHVR